MNESTYYHSVRLDKDKCTGCTNCLKRCPTEAIRVRDGKATIIGERCIDCGECIRVCPYHAKVAVTDELSSINRFKYSIALPAPTLYGQFKNLPNINRVLAGLKMMGFSAVYEVAAGADIVSHAVAEYLKKKDVPKPLISSACPAILRLIRVRFPELIDHIVPIQSPMEVAASLAKIHFARENGVAVEDIGAFFITPCPAKMTSIRSSLTVEDSGVDGAISIMDMYGLLNSQVKKPDSDESLQHATYYGVGWANSGGETTAVGCDNAMAVDGIWNVIRVLEEIENNKLSDLEFFEGLACPGGCVGGPLVFENGFVAKNRIRKLIETLPKSRAKAGEIEKELAEFDVRSTKEIRPLPVMKLDNNIVVALKKMERMESIAANLPGLDCGSCGAPSCRALAEDIVQGNAVEMDCIFKLKEKVRKLALEMVELSKEENK